MSFKLKYKGNDTKPGNPLWDEYIDDKGQSTLTKITPVKIWEACKDCYFIPIDTTGNVQCRKCGLGKKIVTGIELLKNGKIVLLKKE